jgi:hypothetical protein
MQRLQATLALAKTQNGMRDEAIDVSRGVEEGRIPATDAAAEFQKRAAKLRGDALEGYQPEQRLLMDTHLEGVQGDLQRGLGNVIVKRQQHETAAMIDQTGEQLSRLAAVHGPAWAAATHRNLLRASGPAAGFNEEVISKLGNAYDERVWATFYESAALGALQKFDGAALAALRDQVQGEAGNALDPQKRNALVREILSFEHQVRAEQQRKAVEGRFDIASRTKDVQSMVLSGVTPPEGVAPTVAEYTTLHGASGPAMWQQEVGNYLRIGGVIQQMRVASAVDREQMVREQEPAAGPGFAGDLSMRDAVQQAKTLIERQIVADPAAYALKNSPRVQKAASVMQQVLTDPKTTPEDRTAVVDFFARTSVAEQLRLGVDTIRDDRAGNRQRGPKLLTNEQANAISDQFNDQTMGGAKAAVLVQALEAQWGKYWPQVYGQLAADNKLPPAALVIPNMPNDGSRVRMASASVMKMDDLKALVEPSDPKDIKERLLSEFDRAQRTFTSQGADGNRTLATVLGEAEKLALLYRSQGKSVKDSARQAYTETMGHRYEFADTYRVPQTEAPKDVAAGADHALRGLKPEDVQVFSGGAPTILTADALRNRTMWITDGAERGLQLMLRGADGGVYAIQAKDGSPISFGWAALREMAKASRTPEAMRATDIEELRRRQQELNPRR